MMALPFTASVVSAHNPTLESYRYSTTLNVCLDANGADTTRPSPDCAFDDDPATTAADPTVNSAQFGVGSGPDSVTVDFNLTTNDSQEDWNPGSSTWESGKKFQVGFVLNALANCYFSRVVQNNPLNDEAVQNPADGIMGGMLLPLSTTISNGLTVPSGVSVSADGYTVTSNSSGAFLVGAQLPNLTNATLFTGTAKICVESELLYGGEGGIGIDSDQDGTLEHGATPVDGEPSAGVGLHCGSIAGVVEPCTNVNGLGNYNPNCTGCYEYNSTPRIQAERVIAIA